MRVYNSSAILPVFLSITLTITSSAQSISSQEQSLLAAVNQLLQERPLPAEESSHDLLDSTPVKKGPPPDDAAIDELIKYWSHRVKSAKSSGAQGPTDIVRERLLKAAESRPWILPSLYDFLPQGVETHERLFQILNKDPKEFDDILENNWRVSLHWWLESNTQYFRDELIDAVRTRDNNDSDKVDEIEALAKLDWPTAKAQLEKIVASGESVSYPMALSQLYLGAIEDSDTAQAGIYREILKRFLVDGGISGDSRMTILQSLMKDEWTGQEEWFISLFGVPQLSRPDMENNALAIQRVITTQMESHDIEINDLYGRMLKPPVDPLSTALSLNPDRWIPVVAGLTDHNNPAVRNAAISSLAKILNNDDTEQKDRESAARALLPWLSDPNWASAPGRSDLFLGLAKVGLPESAPYLL